MFATTVFAQDRSAAPDERAIVVEEDSAVDYATFSRAIVQAAEADGLIAPTAEELEAAF